MGLPSSDKAKVPYKEYFYIGQQDGSLRSAEIVIPHVLSLFPSSSVVDFGCGTASWLKTFERHGVSDYLGIDGDYVSRQMLRIPVERFKAVDLQNVTELGRRFDLACSLEVAEHLPENRSKQFVAALVKAAPVVLFSAAVPLQGGTEHVNEQLPSYWAKLFAEYGYVALDCIRPLIHADRRIEWWYRQNILIFCAPNKIPAGCRIASSPYELDRILPDMVQHIAAGPHSRQDAFSKIIHSSWVIAKSILYPIFKRR